MKQLIWISPVAALLIGSCTNLPALQAASATLASDTQTSPSPAAPLGCNDKYSGDFTKIVIKGVVMAKCGVNISMGASDANNIDIIIRYTYMEGCSSAISVANSIKGKAFVSRNNPCNINSERELDRGELVELRAGIASNISNNINHVDVRVLQQVIDYMDK